MKQIGTESIRSIPSTDQLPEAIHREVIGQQVDLPGRFPILTDGRQFDLVNEGNVLKVGRPQEYIDENDMHVIESMIRGLVDHARKKLKADGRNLADWKFTAMVAIHHKGQATDFWFGDGPEKEVRVDQSLDEKLRRPVEGQRVKVEKR